VTITYANIDNLEKAEELRILRNECAEWMTKDTRQISAQDQRIFYWQKLATGKVEGFLMYDDGYPVAYGLLIWDEKISGRAWSSTGVREAERGNGYGRKVTIENVRRAHAHGVPMWAEVRRDNAGQQRICLTIGYQVTGTFNRGNLIIDLMRCDEIQEPA
jgi:GNAT superfamily N-acetyltransferase